MFDYSQKKPQAGIEPWPPLTELGANILEGSPQQSGRIDYGSLSTPIIVGIWECTRGKFEITYAYNEMATVLEGSMTITERGGKPVTYGPGDTHFAVKGDHAVWEITEPRIRKCFFIYTGDQVQKQAAE